MDVTLITNDDPIDVEDDCEEVLQIIEQDPDTPREINSHYKLDTIIEKVRGSIREFKYAPVKRDDLLDKYLPKDKSGKTYSLLMDMKTRWSSTFKMLERFELVSEGLRLALIANKSKIQFQAEELAVITMLNKYLKCVSVTLTAICSRSATLINVDNRITALLTRLDDGTAMGTAFAKCVAKRINERRTVASSALQFVFEDKKSVLHPLIIQHSDTEIDSFLVDLNEKVNSPPSPSSPLLNPSDVNTIDTSTESSNGIDEDDFESYSNALDSSLSSKPPKKALDGIEEEIVAMRLSKIRGPLLKKLCDVLLSIQVTSVEAERSFSVGGRICTKINSRLGDESINALSLLYSRFRADEIDEEEKKKVGHKNPTKPLSTKPAVETATNPTVEIVFKETQNVKKRNGQKVVGKAKRQKK